MGPVSGVDGGDSFSSGTSMRARPVGGASGSPRAMAGLFR